LKKILVYEHVSSGSYAGMDLPEWGVIEGYAMLKALIEDFKSLGLQVLTLIDNRLNGQTLNADKIKKVKSKADLESIFRSMLKEADASIIIAPEVNGVLAKLVREAEQLCSLTLNCSRKFFESFPSKAEIYEALNRWGISIPKTLSIGLDEALEDLDVISSEVGFPMVIKPSMGAGCLELNLIRNRQQLKEALERRRETGNAQLIFQKFIDGVPASLSLIALKSRFYIPTLNLQVLRLNFPPKLSQYIGGLTPLAKNIPEKLVVETTKILKALNMGLKGYVGVDLVLADKPYIIEVNPRLTTSYLGMRKIYEINLAEEILKVFLGETPREKVNPIFYTAYFKSEKPAKLNGFSDFSSLNGNLGMLTIYSQSIRDLILRVEKVEPEFSRQASREIFRFRYWRSKY
jgi:hypothetical protein